MNRSPSTLLCTVGTSLFVPNLARLNPEEQYAIEPASADSLLFMDKNALDRFGLWQDREKLTRILKAVKTHYEEERWNRLGQQLTLLPPELRLCGAEINSIEAMIRKRFLSENRNRLILLVSDTKDGQAIGNVLTSYFSHKKCKIGFSACEFLTVHGLQDEKPLIFQREGLTNLVRLLGEQLRKWGTESIAINATGGYKAQIALAVAFGQATKCPVFYKHERFDQIIRFPRVPFTIDLSLVGNHLKLWADMAEPGALFSTEEMERLLPDDPYIKEAIYPMLDVIEEEEDGNYFALSALGMVYWEAFQTLHPELTIRPRKVAQRSGCSFPSHHYPDGFIEYVRKVYDNFPEIISQCHSLPYSGQKGIRETSFYVRDGKVIGEYVDRNGFGARFEVMSSAKNDLERNWVVGRLNDWLKENV